MTFLSINDTAAFMNKLLVKDSFDDFETVSITLSTFADYTINGRINKNFFDDEHNPEAEYSDWGTFKPTCYNLIKGRRTPLKLHIVMKAPSPLLYSILKAQDYPEPYTGLSFFFNIKYEGNRLSIITATSSNTFLLDKSYESIWDRYVPELLTQNNIEFEEQ